MILKFNVKEQTISLVNTKSVPRIGSKDYLVLQFSFSSDWENLNKLVYLQSGDVSQPIDIVDNLVEVPEWFTEQDSFNVTLFGTDGTTEVPTNVVSVQLEKSNDLWVKDAPEPQPSWLVSVLDAAELVKEATVHGPTIGSNGNWYTWDFESKQYIDTGVAASGGSGEGGTTDHTQLTNRDAENQHPMSAITGLLGALGGKVSVADIIDDLTTNAANKPLSAAQGVALKALIDAISIPDKLPNPNALTFTGAVSGSYDGSEAKTINIPSGGGASGDYIPVPATAQVGQTIVVKAVDENGKPTAWEAVDMASGSGSGGSASWVTLLKETLDGSVVSWEFTGLDCADVQVCIYCPVDLPIQSLYQNVYINDVNVDFSRMIRQAKPTAVNTYSVVDGYVKQFNEFGGSGSLSANEGTFKPFNVGNKINTFKFIFNSTDASDGSLSGIQMLIRYR